MIVLLVILLALIVFCLYMAATTSKTKKNAKKRVYDLKAQRNASAYGCLQTVYGLPFAEGTYCEILSCGDHYEFIANGTTVNLEKAKVTDVSIKTDVDVQKQYVSSAGGAVAGAMIAGPLGAMVGGRAKKKETRTYTSYLIFTYVSDGEVKYITFSALGNFQDILKDYKAYSQSNTATTATVNL